MMLDPKVADMFRDAWAFAQGRVRALVERHPGYYPMYTVQGRWAREPELWTHWCEGFLPGMMWLFAMDDPASDWSRLAKAYTQQLERRKYDDTVHDLGFIFLNTYARWATVEQRTEPMESVVVAGMTLAGRFQQAGHYIPSFIGPESLFVDIMMNVPIVMVASQWIREQGQLPPGAEKTFFAPWEAEKVADELWRRGIAHCETSERYLVRSDGSTVHEALFDPQSGRFVRESTHQGLAPDSCWSRGQAWALYGFARVYRLSGRADFLETACRCADYFLRHLPEDLIPPWDFSARRGDAPRDSSAAAIAASGLFTLAELLDDQRRAEHYRRWSRDLLWRLCQPDYLAVAEPDWEGILRHGIYHLPKGLGVDESVAWGEYYFVEALAKWLWGRDLGP